MTTNVTAPGPIGSRAISAFSQGSDSPAIFIVALLIAAGLHGGAGVGAGQITTVHKKDVRVEMAIYTPPPPPPPPPPEPEPEPPPPEPKPKPKPKVARKLKNPPKTPPPVDTPPPPSNQTPPEPTNEPPPPLVTGISMSSTTTAKSGFKVRVGNTTFGDPDEEKFTKADDVKAYSGGSKDFKPVRASAVTRSARPAKKVRPRYPRQLLEQGIEGKVILKVSIGSDGKTRKVKVIKGLHPILDKLSVKAVKRFKWHPAEVDGKKVDSEIRYAFRWEIEY